MNGSGNRKMRNFDRKTAAAGDLVVNGIPYPRMQTLTVQQIPAREWFKAPSVVGRDVAKPVLPLG